MAHQFIPSTEAKTRAAVKKIAPQCQVIAKTDGGWAVFEFVKDYYEWRNQK